VYTAYSALAGKTEGGTAARYADSLDVVDEVADDLGKFD